MEKLMKKSRRNARRRIKGIFLAAIMAALLCASPSYAAESDSEDHSGLRSEAGAHFEIATDGWFNSRRSVGGNVIALEISSPVITCTQLKAQAYGIAYSSTNLAVGGYDSGNVVFNYAYQAYASANGSCSFEDAAYMYIYSKLEHVGYNTYNRGPYIEWYP